MAIAETTLAEWAKVPGAEPLPGYTLVKPLGKGGFGEVWECEVPGGLHKAIKFVPGHLPLADGDEAPAQQELVALQLVKAIRHPFILSMERVEIRDGELLIVTELADKNLAEVLADCQAAGRPGIPREQLLAYVREAAEVLDFMHFQHGLQHLDIKPGNLFLISQHIKVADFGLVTSLAERPDQTPLGRSGITPLYGAPELFQGKISPHCDQYSLAVTYQELLTGTLPIQGKNVRQLMLHHMTAEPKVEALPAADRPVIARALAKDPEQRFSSCLEFVNHLGQPTGIFTTVNLEKRPADISAEPEPCPATGGEAVLPVRQEPSPFPDEIPGFQFLECLSADPLGDLWRVQGPDGRERLAQILPPPPNQGAALVTRLKQLHHPALPATQILSSPSGRVFLVTDLGIRTLRDRFLECRTDGLPGIGRSELLGYLLAAARALDELYQQHRLAHLALNPGNLLVHNDRVLLFEYGLVPLVWLPQGKTAGGLNPRYAAPETYGPHAAAAADQYSLAMIYAELLTGLPPRPSRATARASASRGKLDLDLLPAFDRSVLARALDSDPQRRFPTCTDFLRALEQAGGVQAPKSSFQDLAPLVALATLLLGEPDPEETSLPTVEQFVTQWILATMDALHIGERDNLRYLLRPGNMVEHRCLIRMIPGGLKLKLHDFLKQWSGQRLHQDDRRFVCRIPADRTFWQRCFGGESGLEVQVLLQDLPEPVAQKVEAIIRIQPYGAANARLNEEITQIGPAVIDSVRTYLQAEPDQRGRERWPCRHPLHLYPVFPDLHLGEPVTARGKDISVGGIGLRVQQPLPSEYVYVHLPGDTPVSSLAILAHVLRCQPAADGWHDVGAAFVEPATT